MADYLVWKQNYSVADDSLDLEHKIVIGLINELKAAADARDDDAELKAIASRLLRYTDKHFSHEEQMMRECDYPKLYEHQREHENLRRQTLDFYENLTADSAHDMLKFLGDWWCDHMEESDKAYVRYLQMAMK